MIQRIQSLYLVIVLVLIIIVFCTPLALFSDPSGNLYQLLYKGVVKTSTSGWIIVENSALTTILLVIVLLLTAIGIFLFKNRTKQILACWALLIVLILLAAHIYYIYNSIKLHFSIIKSNLSITSVFPVISAVLVYLAIKAIRKDERLVKSIDRIR
jgi:hypothetical protein